MCGRKKSAFNKDLKTLSLIELVLSELHTVNTVCDLLRPTLFPLGELHSTHPSSIPPI